MTSRLRLVPDGPDAFMITDDRGVLVVRLVSASSELTERLLAATQRWYDVVNGNYRRASGEVRCTDCGLPYRRHPFSEDRDTNGDPWLNVLCNGDLVHL